jgi:histidyl-tRNA synthetase
MKPAILKGTRDFGPKEVRRREYIFHTIKEVFIRYGFQPIETPTMEALATLTGKYGDEGDQLLFKVLNNGDFLAKADEEALAGRDSKKLIPSISRRGLRYDLTVPFARYVVMNQHEIAFPFKRYQIQPVWRADRPAKGRYQEFYQCDVDVVGSSSLMYEAELAQIYDAVFTRLDLPVLIRINHRKVLAGIAEAAGAGDLFTEMTTAIDKWDKVGIEGVRQELRDRGFQEDAIQKILELVGRTELDALAQDLEGNPGVEDLRTVFQYLDSVAPTKNQVLFDPTLARGLSYYTGCIFEVVLDADRLPDIRMGSLGGGGRYDDLTGVFGLKNLPGVGVSFGAERIYDVLEELDRFQEVDSATLQLLIIAFDDRSHAYAFPLLNRLREEGVVAELYPEPVKLKKQMKYADARGVPFVVLIGEEEMASGKLSLKNMQSGDQEKVSVDELMDRFRAAAE